MYIYNIFIIYIYYISYIHINDIDKSFHKYNLSLHLFQCILLLLKLKLFFYIYLFLCILYTAFKNAADFLTSPRRGERVKYATNKYWLTRLDRSYHFV